MRTPSWPLLVVVLAAGGARADAWGDLAGESSGPTVVVGMNRYYPPYEFIDEKGRPAGYNVDLTRAIAEVMGMNVEFRAGKWSELRAGLVSGEIDVLQGISYSEQRSQELEFAPPHAIIHHALFARRGTPPVDSLDALRGHQVLVFRGGIMDEMLSARGLGEGLVRTDTLSDALRLLAAGQGEYVALALLPGIYISRELQLTDIEPVARRVAAERYGYAVKRGNSELLSRFEEGLALLKKTRRYDAIHDAWLGVLEPQGFPWAQVGRWAALVVVPLTLLLGGSFVWNRSLQRVVAQRTESLAREVAERERAVEALRLHQQQLVQAGKLAALGTLLSGVAHEVNNPNGLVLLNLPILKAALEDALEVLDAHQREQGGLTLAGLPYARMREELPQMLDDMLAGSRHIKHIVDDLKNFARKEDNPRLEPVDLNRVAQTAVRLVSSNIKKATQRFEMHLGEGLPPVRANPQRIEQVVVNLLVNACQALPDSARAVRLATRHEPARGEVVLEVQDEGVGISAENLSRIAEPFFTTKREVGGTGLGLSVSTRIVREHGGRLEFASRPGEGTTVTLALPQLAEAVS